MEHCHGSEQCYDDVKDKAKCSNWEKMKNIGYSLGVLDLENALKRAKLHNNTERMQN
jgi:hypothetical protein